MKFMIALAATAATLALAAPAAAQNGNGFGEGFQQTQAAPAAAQSTPATQTSTPTQNTTPTQPQNTFTEISGEARFGGFGNSMFTGDEGFNFVEKAGKGGVKTTVSGACVLNCQDIGFDGYAEEQVVVRTGAIGTKSGEAVSATNHGGAAAMLKFSFQSGPAPVASMPTSAPATAHPSGN